MSGVGVWGVVALSLFASCTNGNGALLTLFYKGFPFMEGLRQRFLQPLQAEAGAQ